MTPFEFLRRFDRIVIVPNGYEDPLVFKPDEEERFNKLLQDCEREKKNVYFQPNGDLLHRMEKKEIESGHWLHVDINSNSLGGSLAATPLEKEVLAERLKEDGATLIVDSGGGLQAYFELSASQPREEIERACRALIACYAPRDLGTHNIDRLLRVPGTTNWPNAKKRAKGREPSPAKLLHDSDVVLDFSDFELAEPERPERKAASGYQFGEVDISDTELPDLPDGLSLLIREMDDSELSATKDGSNSAKAWRAILLMLKHKLKPETVKGICLSLNWSIGLYYHAWASDHGVNVEDEVERQIRKAMSALEPEKVEWPELDEEPEEVSEKKDKAKEHRLRLQDAADLEDEEPEIEIIPEWLPESGLVEVFGPPKAGKSWFTLDLCLHVATGTPWCGLGVKQTPVIYLIGEGKAEIRKRVRAWYKAKGVERKPGQIRFLYRAVRLEPSIVNELMKANPEAFRGPRVVVVDTVNRFMAGDENSTKDMSVFVEACDVLRGPWCGISVHHTGRADEKRPRGSNVLDAALDVKVSTARDKKSGLTEVKVDESRSGATPKPVNFRIRDGVLLIAEKVKVSDNAMQVLQYLIDWPDARQVGIAKELELSKSVVSRAVAELEEKGLIAPKASRGEVGAITPKGEELLRTLLGDFYQGEVAEACCNSDSEAPEASQGPDEEE